MKNKIAICISTIHRDKMLMETINSILDNYQEDWVIIIADQNKIEDYGEEKRMFYETACAKAHTVNPKNDRIKVLTLPYNSGLSYSRNKMVELADSLDIKYCLIGADSIKFNKSMQQASFLTKYLNMSELFNIELLGFGLKDRISWEANLDLKDSFILDFIDKTKKPDIILDDINFWQCDICRNFFLATTKSLLDVKWDDNLKLGEHEDFFWKYKQAGYKVGWTNNAYGEYLPCVDSDYKNIRGKNLRMGKELLKQKYHLKKWVSYINLKNAKKESYD